VKFQFLSFKELFYCKNNGKLYGFLKMPKLENFSENKKMREISLAWKLEKKPLFFSIFELS
jgi:hypothetical protein